MFEDRKHQQVETIIGPSVMVEGNFVGSGDVVVEGQLTGTLKTDKAVRIGERAKVKADLQGGEIFIAGEVRGNIKASGRLELSSTARVIGNIEASTLAIAAGAVFHGRCAMAGLGETQPASAPTAPKKVPRETAVS